MRSLVAQRQESIWWQLSNVLSFKQKLNCIYKHKQNKGSWYHLFAACNHSQLSWEISPDIVLWIIEFLVYIICLSVRVGKMPSKVNWELIWCVKPVLLQLQRSSCSPEWVYGLEQQRRRGFRFGEVSAFPAGFLSVTVFPVQATLQWNCQWQCTQLIYKQDEEWTNLNS